MSETINYETIIGLEIHVQLNTHSKAFCGDAVAFGGAPNTHISAVSLAHPGTLPRANAAHIKSAVELGLALGCKINQKNTFDRKNYFYADLPKGYQITQDKTPICGNGFLQIRLSDGSEKTIRIHHLHCEEDAGKSLHDQDPINSYIDLNRAGTPLLEIVTEPDLRSGEEVEVCMTAMRQLVRWLNISDGNMEEGSMRCDVNISVRPFGTDILNTRCEVKNVNSMRFARRAVEYESKRQIQLMEIGGKVVQSTLNFDPVTGVTMPLRSKENAHDYRYFPDPDLPPVVISNAELAASETYLRSFSLPHEALKMLTDDFSLSLYDALIITEDRAVFEYFKQQTASLDKNLYKPAANLLINKLLPYAKEKSIALKDLLLTPAQLISFLQLIESGSVSHSAAYQNLLPVILENPNAEPKKLAANLNLMTSNNADELEIWIKTVIEQNPEKVKDYKKGKKGLIGFFMGEIMKLSKGKADAKLTQTILQKKLENE